MTARIEADVPESQYHADPALSYSGMKTLLDCPARFAWEREHGRPERAAYDFGHAAHQLVLGVGDPIAIIDADDFTAEGLTSHWVDAIHVVEGKATPPPDVSSFSVARSLPVLETAKARAVSPAPSCSR